MDNKSERKKNFYLIIGIVIFSFCVTGATYAYFALTAFNNSITGVVGGTTLSLNVSKILPTTQNTNMIPQLESTLGDAISSEYNCVDDHNNVICHLYKVTVNNVGNTSDYLTGTISFTNVNNLPNLKWKRIDNATTLGVYSSYKATIGKSMFEEKKLFSANESAEYYFVVWINETGEIQTDNGTFRATINFESSDGTGITSTVRPEEAVGAAKTVQDLYNDGSTLKTVRIGGLDTKPAVTLNETQGIMLDNNGEYRYYGANPDNYVSFNGELWRIIGVSTVRTNENDPVGERRIKIIRNDLIGVYSYDSSTSTVNSGYGVNEWSTADLNTELNTLYYNKQSGTCYNGQNNVSTTCDFTSIGLSDESKTLIDDALWYLGGNVNYYGEYASDLYSYERGVRVYGCSSDSCGGTRTTRWTGKVGLMYPSDYMYATDLDVCVATNYNETDSSQDYRNTNCKDNDWLYNSAVRQWILSPYASNANNVFSVNLSGDVFAYHYATHPLGVRPAVYLKSDVVISGGEGTSSNPYTLSN